MLRQWATIPGLELFQSRPPISAQRLIAGYPLREQQSFEAIYVFDLFGDQHLARQRRRRSSSSGVGTLTIAHTRGSPRLYASSARTSASPSILSVFARRRRRDVAIEAGSTIWLLIPLLWSTR